MFRDIFADYETHYVWPRDFLWRSGLLERHISYLLICEHPLQGKNAAKVPSKEYRPRGAKTEGRIWKNALYYQISRSKFHWVKSIFQTFLNTSQILFGLGIIILLNIICPLTFDRGYCHFSRGLENFFYKKFPGKYIFLWFCGCLWSSNSHNIWTIKIGLICHWTWSLYSKFKIWFNNNIKQHLEQNKQYRSMSEKKIWNTTNKFYEMIKMPQIIF